MLENNICVGSTVEIIRSGEVIPKHINTLSFDKESFEKFSESIKKCPCCGSDTYWGDTKVDLICSNSKCPSRVLNSLIFFFGVIDIEKFGEGEISKLYNLGYDTPEKILNLTYNDLINIDGWGNSKISTLLNQFNKYKTDGIPLAKLMQALDLFKGKLGEKTAQKIFDEYNDLSNLNIEELNTIEGVSDITANVFIDAYTKYLETYQNYIVKVSYIKTPKKEIIGDKYINMSICMTGFRDDELSNLIQSHGGKIVSGVSKKTTHLLVKDLNSESNKATKARELGIPIMTKDEFLNL
jgi:NAD-dependent DNA ligase